ncbi:MAG: response regulator transcription factor [Hyphomicrobium aestuarii]|nr:response regulator transcription factor [Hyphomicrobium aestuarii]
MLAMTLRAEADFDVVATGTTAADAVKIAARLSPDVIIIDLDLGKGCGLDAVRQIAAEHPSVRTLVFTAHDDLLQTHRAFEAGARGFLAKGVSAGELSGAVRAIMAGQRFVTLPPAKPASTGQAAVSDQPAKTLSERETMILSAVSVGKTNGEIATELGVPEGTIRKHVANLLRKLNLKRRILAAITVARNWN